MMTTKRLVGDFPLKSDMQIIVSDSPFYTPVVYPVNAGTLLPMTYPQTRPLPDLNLTLPDSSMLEGISKGDNLDVSEQLHDMHALQNGWLEGEGLAPPEAGLAWLSEVFGQHFPATTPSPYLYPTPMGGVQAEWSLGPIEITLDVNLQTHSGEWHEFNLKTSVSTGRILDCNSDEDWKWLVARVKGLSGVNT